MCTDLGYRQARRSGRKRVANEVAAPGLGLVHNRPNALRVQKMFGRFAHSARGWRFITHTSSLYGGTTDLGHPII